MTHPRLTSVDGTQSAWLAQIGPLGSWGDLAYSFRYGDGACGMFEASWTMPLPPDFSHPLLQRGSLVELMDGPQRIGSPLVLTEPSRGAGFSDPWTFTAAGIGREIEGENSFYALDGSGNSTDTASTAVDQAIVRGWRVAGRAANVGAAASTVVPIGGLATVGALLSMIGARDGTRWGVGQDNLVRFYSDPTTPTYEVVPGASALGVADDDYATTVLVRYVNSTTHTFATVKSPSSPSPAANRYGPREFPVDLTDRGEISAASAQSRADGILALAKGRLGWTNGLTLTSQEILCGGVPADLSKVAEDVGSGCMIRLHGVFDDLVVTSGKTWLDIIVGEAKYAADDDVIDLTPLGLVAVDLSSVIEAVAGKPAA